MTEEDIKQKAKEYAHDNYEILTDTDDAFVTSEAYLEQGYLAGAIATNKANEWHYVKDGDLPSDRHGHVVINQDWDKVTIRNGRFEYLDGYKANVIAWKEIVLPELKEKE